VELRVTVHYNIRVGERDSLIKPSRCGRYSQFTGLDQGKEIAMNKGDKTAAWLHLVLTVLIRLNVVV
jgi:predicted transcriptional regulator